MPFKRKKFNKETADQVKTKHSNRAFFYCMKCGNKQEWAPINTPSGMGVMGIYCNDCKVQRNADITVYDRESGGEIPDNLKHYLE